MIYERCKGIAIRNGEILNDFLISSGTTQRWWLSPLYFNRLQQIQASGLRNGGIKIQIGKKAKNLGIN